MKAYIVEPDVNAHDVLQKQLEIAKKKLLGWMVEQFPTGSIIVFDHHGYIQQGEVLSHSNSWWSDPDMFVRNVNTGTERRITLYDVIQAYRSLLGIERPFSKNYWQCHCDTDNSHYGYVFACPACGASQPGYELETEQVKQRVSRTLMPPYWVCKCEQDNVHADHISTCHVCGVQQEGAPTATSDEVACSGLTVDIRSFPGWEDVEHAEQSEAD